jgi:hypothetical protein
VTRVVLIVVTLALQRILGLPGLPPIASELLLPMVWLVAPALAEKNWRSSLPGLWLGLGWDLVIEPVVGPGAIAWSAAGLAVRSVGSVLAVRSARAWFLLGAVGGTVVALIRPLAELPLGLETPFGWTHVLRSALLTAAWCGLAGWFLTLDLPGRWRRNRARRLR